MRKPGENAEPISHDGDSEFPVTLWQRYASPVWMDINQSRTLQYMQAREDQDERHICPLQLDVIERGLEMWSLHGDTVLSPFAGIGSEGYCAVRMGRNFLGVELKESYWRLACENLKQAEIEPADMFGSMIARGVA
jgi:DNA modification methylase